MDEKVPQPHSEEETVLELFKLDDERFRNGGYRIIGRQIVDPNRVTLHVEVWGASQKMEAYIRMEKTGEGWKFDGFKQRVRSWAPVQRRRKVLPPGTRPHNPPGYRV